MRLFSLLMITLLCAGCFPARPVDPVPDALADALGMLRLSSPRGGTLSITPTTCTAGDRAFFLGGDFADAKTSSVVGVLFEPLDGPAIRVISPSATGETPLVFRRPQCKVMRATLESTGLRINDVYDYRITLDVDCLQADGTALAGKVSTTHCH